MTMNNIPFPQANSIEFMMEILWDFPYDGMSSSELTDLYDLHHIRVAEYYLNALRFIAAVDKDDKVFYLTEKGKQIRGEGCSRIKYIKFLNLIFANEDFYTMYNSGELLDPELREAYYQKYLSEKYEFSDATAKRRASTVTAWFSYIDRSINV